MSFEVPLALHFCLWENFFVSGLPFSFLIFLVYLHFGGAANSFSSLNVSCVFPSFSRVITKTFMQSYLFFSLYSTNGTVINKLKVVKKQTYPLQTGDVIYVVYRKNEPENSK